MIQSQQLRYFLYARKSSESEDRQMASIDDQIKEVRRIAKNQGLNIVAVFSESKSAKNPGRKAFNEMLLEIEKGNADAILCWKLNRLARNPVDGGKISWLLQQNVIKHIQCYDRDYKPSDNVLMMQIELGMANQFVKDLSADIKRGVRAKAERGWNPSPILPIGYIHNKNAKRKVCSQEISIDKKRYSVVKKLWDLMLTGHYSLASIKRKGDQLGLTSRNKKPYVIATYHNMFSSEFYYGYFYWENDLKEKVRYKGKHPLMITEQEFDRVQYLIGNRKKQTRPKKYDYPYRGLITCGECKSSITAERKHQVRCTGCRNKFSCMHRDDCPKCQTKIKDMKNPTVIDITYYRCTKRKKKCSQKFITKTELEKQYITMLTDIEVSEEFCEFICGELEILYQQENTTDLDILKVQKRQISELNTRFNNLSLMRADNEITSDEFKLMRIETRKKISALEKELKNNEFIQINWLQIVKDYLLMAKNASLIIQNSDSFTKNNLLSKLGSNQILFNQKLHIIKAEPLLAIRKCYDYYSAEKERFEPVKNLVKQGDLQGFYTENTSWCSGLYKVRTSTITLKQQQDYLLVA